VVALLHRGDARPDVDHDARALVPEDRGEQAFRIGARARELVGVAHAGGLDLDQHLAGLRTVERHRRDLERLAFSNATAARTSIAVSPWSRSLVPPRMRRGGIASTNTGPENAKGRGLRRALANPDACRMSGFRLRHDADIGLGRLPALRVLL